MISGKYKTKIFPFSMSLQGLQRRSFRGKMHRRSGEVDVVDPYFVMLHFISLCIAWIVEWPIPAMTAARLRTSESKGARGMETEMNRYKVRPLVYFVKIFLPYYSFTISRPAELPILAIAEMRFRTSQCRKNENCE